jgi:sulfite reductase beta subunit-like hemoprotein
VDWEEPTIRRKLSPEWQIAIGYVSKEEVYDLVKAIVATQRDYRNRSDRRHARMKYILEEWGVEKFAALLKVISAKKLPPTNPSPIGNIKTFWDGMNRETENYFMVFM